MLQDVKSYIRRCFTMKDLGKAAYILRIKIYRDRSWRLIGASTPAELKRMQNVPYASAVGSIMYVVRCIRLDVAFAQNITSRFQQNPGNLHWTTVKNILKYLKNTKDMFLTGYAKQSIFVTLSAKAKYIAAYDASKEVRILNKNHQLRRLKRHHTKVWHGQAPKLSYLKVWGCEALVKRDTLTKPEKLEPRSTRTRHAPDRMCLYIDVEEHELGDLGEPANYKAALLDPESDKWLNAIN
ncbi:hypothetical protein Tco_0755748 [Tanacetum coccineum]